MSCLIKQRFLAIPITLVLLSVVNAQSDAVRQMILQKAKEIYGDAAPSSVTFLTRYSNLIHRPTMTGQLDKAGSHASPNGDAQNTATGDEATGVIQVESGNELYLDVSPCNLKVATFVKPYRKVEMGKVTCGEKILTKHRVIKE